MNYWDEDDYDVLYNIHSSGETTGGNHDHFDITVQPTKDKNIQSEDEQPLKSDSDKYITDGKIKQTPFHLTIHHQTIGHKKKGRQHQVLFTSKIVV